MLKWFIGLFKKEKPKPVVQKKVNPVVQKKKEFYQSASPNKAKRVVRHTNSSNNLDSHYTPMHSHSESSSHHSPSCSSSSGNSSCSSSDSSSCY